MKKTNENEQSKQYKALEEIKQNSVYQKHSNLHHNSKEMYKILGPLQKAIKPYCYNEGREWSLAEKLNVKNNVNITNVLSVGHYCAINARTPFSIFFIYTNMMWMEYLKGKKQMFNQSKNFGITASKTTQENDSDKNITIKRWIALLEEENSTIPEQIMEFDYLKLRDEFLIPLFKRTKILNLYREPKWRSAELDPKHVYQIISETIPLGISEWECEYRDEELGIWDITVPSWEVCIAHGFIHVEDDKGMLLTTKALKFIFTEIKDEDERK